MDYIVTGAGRGIGFETTRILCKAQGNRIIAISRNIRQLHNLEHNNNNLVSELFPLSFDVVKGDYNAVLIPLLKELKFSLDGLFNNAAVLVNKPLSQYLDDDFRHVFSTNVEAPFRMIRYLLPFFNKGSHILNAGSIGGVQGSVKFPGLSLYSASKGALAVLTECLAEELKSRKISVNCLAFGAVQTEMLNEAFPGHTAQVKASEMGKYVAEFLMHGHLYYNGKILPVSLSTP